MTKTLQDLRKEAGYKSAKEFAEAIGMSESSYSRYEASPDNISMKAAIKLADFLGCSLDMVMGREPVTIEDMRGDVQKFYDSLSEENRKLFDEFSEFIAVKEEKAAERLKAEEDRRFMARTISLENHYLQSQRESEEKDKFYLLGSPEAIMLGFFAYVFDVIDKETEEDLIDEMHSLENRKFQELLDELSSKRGGSSSISIGEEDGLKEEAKQYVKLHMKALEHDREERRDYLVRRILKAYKELHPEEKEGFEYAIVNLD